MTRGRQCYEFQHKTHKAVYCCIDFSLYSPAGVQCHTIGFDPRLLSPIRSKRILQVENVKQDKANHTILGILI